MPPIDPKKARQKLDCISTYRKELADAKRAMNQAYDHIRDGQSMLAKRVLAQALGLEDGK